MADCDMNPNHICLSVAVRSQLGKFGRFLWRMDWNLAYVRINLLNLRPLQGFSSNGAQPRCDLLFRLDLLPRSTRRRQGRADRGVGYARRAGGASHFTHRAVSQAGVGATPPMVEAA